jgi:formyltetrahydrofolate synthetase
VLLYEKDTRGRMRLTGVEYIVLDADGDLAMPDVHTFAGEHIHGRLPGTSLPTTSSTSPATCTRSPLRTTCWPPWSTTTCTSAVAGRRSTPRSVTWGRVLDVNDRALRNIVIGLGGRLDGVPRTIGFDITAASEVMAILALSTSLSDLRERLGRIVVGCAPGDDPVTAEQLQAAGAMAVILRGTR